MKQCKMDSKDWRWIILVISGGVLVSGCAMTSLGGASRLPGTSEAAATLQRDTAQLVMMYDTAADDQCENRRIVNTEITVYPEIPGKSAWAEKWTVDRCGEIAYYAVGFTPTPKRGGTDFSVSPMKEE